MKFYYKTLVIVTLISTTFIGCKNKDDSISITESSSINKIMPLGASRVEGFRPVFESFRYELWKDLVENNFTFDFIGTKSDSGSYPTFNNLNFDTDHEGRSGWTSEQILNNIEIWLNKTGAPDVVLFSSPGGNDGLRGVPYTKILTNINGIIDILQKKNPNIVIVLEQLAPAKSSVMTPEVTLLFNQLHKDITTIATNKTTTTSQIIAVDMFTGFTDDLLADNLHYNTKGADFIAIRYYNVLKDILKK